MINPNSASPPQVLVSILNWNNARATIRCLESLRAGGYLESPQIQVLVVDNGSEQGDFEALAAYANNKSVELLKNPENMGFAGGHNRALRIAIERKVPYAWLLNNDTIVPAGVIEKLALLMEDDPECGACSPCIAYEDTRRTYFSGAIEDWTSLASQWCEPPDDQSFDTRNADRIWLFGTALFLRTGAIEEIGGLNEEYFAYYEDNELGARLRLAGWGSRISRQCVVFHGPEPRHEVKRPAYFYYLMARNHSCFFLKYTPAEYRRLIRVRLAASLVHRSDLLLAVGRRDLCDAGLLGLEDGFKARLGRPDLGRAVSPHFRLFVAAVRAANRLHRLLLARRGR